MHETLISNNPKILIYQESLGRVEKRLSPGNTKCEKPLCNDNITHNSLIQADANHTTNNRRFRKNKKLLYARELLREGEV